MPRPSGHYSLAVRRDQWIHVAGQTGEDDDARLGDLAEQTHQAIANIAAILREHGADLGDIVRATCYLTDVRRLRTFEAAYSAALHPHRPARTTVGVAGLPDGALIEIEATATVPRPDQVIRV